MKWYYLWCLILLMSTQQSDCTMAQSDKTTPKYAIAIHGGAGAMSRLKKNPHLKEQYLRALDTALHIGSEVLKDGGTALDAVEKVIRYLEDNRLFNAGKGSVANALGEYELDASIMDGKTLLAGAVAGVSRIRHPISAARAVMEKTPHVLIAGTGAEALAEKWGLEMVDPAFFHGNVPSPSSPSLDDQLPLDKWGTVGCVALDQYGNLAAGTSTGGLSKKHPGRIGDSPIIGAGTYADNATCAVSCTGVGEYFIRLAIAHDLSARMKYKNLPLSQAATETLQRLSAHQGKGGFIAIDTSGNIVTPFNTPAMFRAYQTPDGQRHIAIFPD